MICRLSSHTRVPIVPGGLFSGPRCAELERVRSPGRRLIVICLSHTHDWLPPMQAQLKCIRCHCLVRHHPRPVPSIRQLRLHQSSRRYLQHAISVVKTPALSLREQPKEKHAFYLLSFAGYTLDVAQTSRTSHAQLEEPTRIP